MPSQLVPFPYLSTMFIRSCNNYLSSKKSIMSEPKIKLENEKLYLQLGFFFSDVRRSDFL